MLKRCPNVLFSFCCHAHPALFPFEDSQDVPRRWESASVALSSTQPAPLWSVTWFCMLVFTPSVDGGAYGQRAVESSLGLHIPMMSISPAFGHDLALPRDQYAGQTPQPWGIE